MAESPFIILYETPVYGRPEINRLLWNPVPAGIFQVPLPFATHFIAPFTATRYRQPVLSPPPQDRNQEEGTHLHFVAQFRQTQYRPPILSPPPQDRNQEEGTHLHFIAQFRPTQYRQPLVATPQDFSTAFPPSSESGANPHFISKFSPTGYIQPKFAPPSDIPVPPTDVPTYFLARFAATTYWLDRSLWQKVPEDVSGPFVSFETNVNFLSPFIQTRYSPPFVSAPATDVPPVVPVETNTNFLARYVQTSYRAAVLPSSAADVSLLPPPADAPVNFVATYRGTQFFLDRNAFQQPAGDVPPLIAAPDPGANPSYVLGGFMGSFQQPIYKVDITSTRQAIASDFSGAVVGPGVAVQRIWAMALVRYPL